MILVEVGRLYVHKGTAKGDGKGSEASVVDVIVDYYSYFIDGRYASAITIDTFLLLLLLLLIIMLVHPSQ